MAAPPFYRQASISLFAHWRYTPPGICSACWATCCFQVFLVALRTSCSRGSPRARIWAAKMAAFLAPALPMAMVATGTPGGHLHRGQEAVQAVQMGAGHGHADDRQGGLRGQDPGQMGRHPGHGNDDLEPPGRRVPGIGLDPLGGPVGRSHHHLKGDAPLLEQYRRGLHLGPIRGAAQNDADVNCAPYYSLHSDFLRGGLRDVFDFVRALTPSQTPLPTPLRDWGWGLGGRAGHFGPWPPPPNTYPARRRRRIFATSAGG